MSLSIENSSGQVVSFAAGVSPAAATTADAVELLPLPNGGDAQTDAMTWLYLFVSKQKSLDVSSGKSTIENTQRMRDEAYKQELEAIKQAVEAAEHSSFWDSLASVALDIGKVAAIVGSVAVAVGTGGAGIVGVIAVAGALLSTASFVEGEAHVLSKLGVDEGTASWIGVGLAIGGAACSGGAGLVAGAGSGVAQASTLQKVATTSGDVASVASGAATAAGGAAKIASKQYAGDQTDALADATGAQMIQGRLQRFLLMMLADLKAAQESDDATLGALRGALKAKAETLVLTTTMRA
ncbi:MAG TPA: hypothetical protein VJV79_31610 [Polyangiaceae bacterium]|nr:hypothetical protein [Polyangiaceae bacterium]